MLNSSGSTKYSTNDTAINSSTSGPYSEKDSSRNFTIAARPFPSPSTYRVTSAKNTCGNNSSLSFMCSAKMSATSAQLSARARQNSVVFILISVGSKGGIQINYQALGHQTVLMTRAGILPKAGGLDRVPQSKPRWLAPCLTDRARAWHRSPEAIPSTSTTPQGTHARHSPRAPKQENLKQPHPLTHTRNLPPPPNAKGHGKPRLFSLRLPAICRPAPLD